MGIINVRRFIIKDYLLTINIKAPSFPIISRNILSEETFASRMIEALDKYFHFGMGRQSGIVFSGSESSGVAFDLSDLSCSEASYAISKNTLRLSTQLMEGQEIWHLTENRITGELGFTRKFCALVPSSIYGEFVQRTATHAWDGLEYVPKRIKASEITQIVDKRLLPFFGKSNLEVAPMENGRKLAFEDIGPNKKYNDWEITVYLNRENIESFLKLLVTYSETREWPELGNVRKI